MSLTRSNRKVLAFLAITFGVDWALIIGLRAAGVEVSSAGVGLSVGFFAVLLFMVMPSIAAVIVQRAFGDPVREPLGVRFAVNRWFLVAWLGPIVLALAALVIGLAFPGAYFDPEMTDLVSRFEQMLPPEQIAEMEQQLETMPVHPVWLTLVQILLLGPTVNALFGFGEELGWRGLLQRELAPMGFWRASLAIGLVWGLWHAPLILLGHNYPQHPQLGVGLMVLWCVLLAVPFSYVRVKSRSVVAVAILHGVLNASAGLPLMLTSGGSDLTIGVTGAAGMIALAAVAAIIAALDPHPSLEEFDPADGTAPEEMAADSTLGAAM